MKTRFQRRFPFPLPQAGTSSAFRVVRTEDFVLGLAGMPQSCARRRNRWAFGAAQDKYSVPAPFPPCLALEKARRRGRGLEAQAHLVSLTQSRMSGPGSLPYRCTGILCTNGKQLGRKHAEMEPTEP